MIQSSQSDQTPVLTEGASTNIAAQHPSPRSNAVEQTPLQVIEQRLNQMDLLEQDAAIKGSGLVPRHAHAVGALAERKNTWVMFRPVNKLSTQLIDEGAAGKGLNVKSKSSDWGPMAGYIPADARLSKKWKHYAANPGSVPSFQEAEGVKKVPLSITQERIRTLVSQGIIRLEKSEPESKYRTLTALSTEENHATFGGPGQLFQFRCQPDGLGTVAVEYITLPRQNTPGQRGEAKPPENGGKNWKPVEVLAIDKNTEQTAEPEGSAMLTADYDLFAVLPTLENARRASLGAEEGAPMPSIIPTRATTSTPPTEQACSSRVLVGRNTAGHSRLHGVVQGVMSSVLNQPQRRTSDSETGRETAFQQQFRRELNVAIGHKEGDLVKHGTEQDNWAYPERDDHIFVVAPNGRFYQTKNAEQVRDIFGLASQAGYLAYENRKSAPVPQYVKDLQEKLGKR